MPQWVAETNFTYPLDSSPYFLAMVSGQTRMLLPVIIYGLVSLCSITMATYYKQQQLGESVVTSQSSNEFNEPIN